MILLDLRDPLIFGEEEVQKILGGFLLHEG